MVFFVITEGGLLAETDWGRCQLVGDQPLCERSEGRKRARVCEAQGERLQESGSVTSGATSAHTKLSKGQ